MNGAFGVQWSADDLYWCYSYYGRAGNLNDEDIDYNDLLDFQRYEDNKYFWEQDVFIKRLHTTHIIDPEDFRERTHKYMRLRRIKDEIRMEDE